MKLGYAPRHITGKHGKSEYDYEFRDLHSMLKKRVRKAWDAFIHQTLSGRVHLSGHPETKHWYKHHKESA